MRNVNAFGIRKDEDDVTWFLEPRTKFSSIGLKADSCELVIPTHNPPVHKFDFNIDTSKQLAKLQLYEKLLGQNHELLKYFDPIEALTTKKILFVRTSEIQDRSKILTLQNLISPGLKPVKSAFSCSKDYSGVIRRLQLSNIGNYILYGVDSFDRDVLLLMEEAYLSRANLILVGEESLVLPGVSKVIEVLNFQDYREGVTEMIDSLDLFRIGATRIMNYVKSQ